MMDYKGYTATITVDAEAGVLHGRVLNIRDVITFEADTVADLRREFEASVDDYLEFCAERGVDPEKPFSGQFLIRTEPAIHRAAMIAATRAGQSLNVWVVQLIQNAVSPAKMEATAFIEQLLPKPTEYQIKGIRLPDQQRVNVLCPSDDAKLRQSALERVLNTVVSTGPEGEVPFKWNATKGYADVS